MTRRLNEKSDLIPSNIPLRFQCFAASVRWKRKHDNRGLLLLYPEKEHTDGATTYDPWEKRTEFFRLAEGDIDALVGFLETVGYFENPSSVDMDYMSRTEKFFWEERAWAQEELQGQNDMMSGYDLTVYLECRKGEPHALIRTYSFEEALALTVQIDRITGAKVTKCARPDCGVLFSSSNGHERKYCTWYCSHIESVRRQRRNAKAQARKAGKAHGKQL